GVARYVSGRVLSEESGWGRSVTKKGSQRGGWGSSLQKDFHGHLGRHSADLQFLPRDLYAICIMGRMFRKHRLGLARRCVAFAALVSFTIGNIGWSQSAEKPGERGCCGKLVKLSTGGGCCCGKSKEKASCGCGKALAE